MPPPSSKRVLSHLGLLLGQLQSKRSYGNDSSRGKVCTETKHFLVHVDFNTSENPFSTSILFFLNDGKIGGNTSVLHPSLLESEATGKWVGQVGIWFCSKFFISIGIN